MLWFALVWTWDKYFVRSFVKASTKGKINFWAKLSQCLKGSSETGQTTHFYLRHFSFECNSTFLLIYVCFNRGNSPRQSLLQVTAAGWLQAGADHAAPAASLTIEIAVWMPFSNPQMVRDGEKLGGGWGWWCHSSQDNPVKVVVSLRRSIIRCCADQPWLNAATGVMIRQDTTQDVDSLDAIVTLVLEFASKPLSSCGFLYL